MTLQVFVAVAIVVAVVSLAWSRRVARRLEQLTESYWELRYEHGQLRARVARLDPDEPAEAAPAPTPAPSTTTFVPLSSMKR